jgi:DNA-binding transcriptional LysR family regulator
VDLDALHMFMEVVRTGSFLSAANALGVARPTLKRRIEALEAQAGVPLLARQRQGVVPTEAGQVLATRARAVIDDARALVGAVREVGTLTHGRLRILAPVGLPPALVALVVSHIAETYPKLRLDFDFASDPFESPALQGADGVVCFGTRQPTSGFTAFELWSCPQQLLASPAYLRQHGVPRTPSDLRKHRLLVWRAPDDGPRIPDGRGGDLRVEPWMVSADVHMLRQAASDGLGIAYVPNATPSIEGPAPAMGVGPSARAPELQVVLPALVRPRNLVAFVPSALAATPRVRAALSATQEVARAFAAFRREAEATSTGV